MPALMIFQKESDILSLSEISEALTELLGLTCAVQIEGERIELADYDGVSHEFHSGQILVDLPGLEENEGNPIVDFQITPRLDRDEAMQSLVDEILEQEGSLRDDLDRNLHDILLTSDDSPAGVEAASVIAYIIASETQSGVLVRTEEEEVGTVWFTDAEDFADFVFGEEDEDGDEDGDEEDGKGSDDEDEDESDEDVKD